MLSGLVLAFDYAVNVPFVRGMRFLQVCRKCTYKAIATHTTTSVLPPSIRNHQIIRTAD